MPVGGLRQEELRKIIVMNIYSLAVNKYSVTVTVTVSVWLSDSEAVSLTVTSLSHSKHEVPLRKSHSMVLTIKRL